MPQKNKFSTAFDTDYGISVLEITRSGKFSLYLAYIIVLLIVSTLALLIFVPWQQTVRGYGKVTAFTPLERKQTVQAPVYGRISKWYVSEGSSVKKGEPLLEITDIDENYVKRLNEQKLAIINMNNAYQLKIDAINHRINDLRLSKLNAEQIATLIIEQKQAKQVSAQRELEYAQADFDTAELNYERLLKLDENLLTSRRKLELAELKYKQAKAKLEKNRADLRATESEYQTSFKKKEKTVNDTNAKINKEKSELATAISYLEKNKQELSKIEVLLSRQQARIIKAPLTGTVFRLTKVLQTEYVKIGDKLATLIPDAQKLAVELWLDGNDIPLVMVGDTVRLQFEGWPALQFSGWPSVAVGTFPGKVALVDQSNGEDGKFRIVVIPDESSEKWPSDQYLKQGTRSYGWVLLREVKLWFELWRQFNGFPPVIVNTKDIKDVPVKVKSK